MQDYIKAKTERDIVYQPAVKTTVYNLQNGKQRKYTNLYRGEFKINKSELQFNGDNIVLPFGEFKFEGIVNNEIKFILVSMPYESSYNVYINVYTSSTNKQTFKPQLTDEQLQTIEDIITDCNLATDYWYSNLINKVEHNANIQTSTPTDKPNEVIHDYPMYTNEYVDRRYYGYDINAIMFNMQSVNKLMQVVISEINSSNIHFASATHKKSLVEAFNLHIATNNEILTELQNGITELNNSICNE